MDNKKILNAAGEKIRDTNNAENVAGQDKSLLGDVLGMVAGVASASSGGKPNALSILSQIQNLAGSANSSSGKPDAANLLGQIQSLVNLFGGMTGGNAGGSNLISQIQSIANLAGGTSSGKPDVSNLISQVQNLANMAGNQSAASSSNIETSAAPARESSESGGKVSGRKPNGRVANIGRKVADQLRERKNSGQ